MPTTAELMVNDLSVQFGGLKAVNEVSFSLEPQTLAGLIGPNGAGKTTIFNALTGLCPVTGGEISFNDNKLTNQPPHTIARCGIARTFQNIRLFNNLSVLDNLRIAYHKNRRYSLLCGLFRSPVSIGKKRKSPPGPKKHWIWWAWQIRQSTWPAACPMVSNGGWRSPEP